MLKLESVQKKKTKNEQSKMKYIPETVLNKLDSKSKVFIIFDSLFKIIADAGVHYVTIK